MKTDIRIEGTKDHIKKVIFMLEHVFIIHSKSKHYKNRNDNKYRVYLVIEVVERE